MTNDEITLAKLREIARLIPYSIRYFGSSGTIQLIDGEGQVKSHATADNFIEDHERLYGTIYVEEPSPAELYLQAKKEEAFFDEPETPITELRRKTVYPPLPNSVRAVKL